jgi:hypothetical protein
MRYGSDSPKPRFPWKRLASGVYFSFAGMLALLRTASMKRLGNPYIKQAAITIFVVGFALLASGIWASIDRKQAK